MHFDVSCCLRRSQVDSPRRAGQDLQSPPTASQSVLLPEGSVAPAYLKGESALPWSDRALLRSGPRTGVDCLTCARFAGEVHLWLHG